MYFFLFKQCMPAEQTLSRISYFTYGLMCYSFVNLCMHQGIIYIMFYVNTNGKYNIFSFVCLIKFSSFLDKNIYNWGIVVLFDDILGQSFKIYTVSFWYTQFMIFWYTQFFFLIYTVFLYTVLDMHHVNTPHHQGIILVGKHLILRSPIQ